MTPLVTLGDTHLISFHFNLIYSKNNLLFLNGHFVNLTMSGTPYFCIDISYILDHSLNI